MTPDRIAELAEIFMNRIKKQRQSLWPWAQANRVTSFRVYDQDMPDIPFIVDEYEKHLHIAQMVEPAIDPELQALWSTSITDAAARGIGVPKDRVYLKHRRQQKDHSQYERQGSQSYVIQAQENGLGFKVNLSDYLDTGLFLDHRDTRSLVRSLANGARVLNLFAYTASFSVYAAAGGAIATTSVDLSKTYTTWAAENLALNGFGSKMHRCLSAEVGTFLDEAIARRDHYDIIVLDPPTFSNSKKMDATFDVQRDHPRLINQCLRLLPPQGILVFSNNRRGFKLDNDAINCRYVDDITNKTIPEDFKGKRPHKCFILKKT